MTTRPRLRRSLGPALAAVASAWVLLATGAQALAATVARGPVADDIRDIRPLISIPVWWRPFVPALVAFLVAVALVLVYRFWRRRATAPASPEERAELALAAADLLARQGRCREWAELVARTLRTALADRLGEDGCPQTTSELASIDWSARPEGSAVDAPRLLELLSACDLTRFALGRLDASSLIASTESARRWVEHLFAVPSAPSATHAEVTP